MVSPHHPSVARTLGVTHPAPRETAPLASRTGPTGLGGVARIEAMSKLGDRFRVIGTNYKMASEYDPKLGWILAGIFVVIMGVFIAIGAATSNMITWVLIGLAMAVLTLAIVFSRRAMKSAYKSIEGKPGAAVAVIQSQQMVKAGWSITPAVAVNKAQDLVHRAVGRPGIVLVGEGQSAALGGLMAAERKRTQRYVADIPITDIVIGDGPGQVPITRLESQLRKMNKVLAPGEVTEIRKRLDALASNPLPVPKGPLPKNSRQIPRGKQR